MNDCGHASSLAFVDLAGSEDISKSQVTGKKATESKHINKSLFALGRVIDALASNQKHIPYRDSKLTQLLSEALGGMCQTTFIACVSPVINSFRETNNTLRYARRAMQALNISQQPQWKQDKIMLEGLTKKCVMLTVQIEEQAAVHRAKTARLKEENKKMLAAQVFLHDQLVQLPVEVQRLLADQRAAFAARIAEAEMAAENRIAAIEMAAKKTAEAHDTTTDAVQSMVTAFTTADVAKAKLFGSVADAAVTAASNHTEASRREIATVSADAEALTTSMAQIDKSLHDSTTSYITSTTSQVADATTKSKSLLHRATVHIAGSVSAAQTNLDAQVQARAASIRQAAEKAGTALATANQHARTSNTGLEGSVSAVASYVDDQIKRDPKIVGPCPKYAYPSAFAPPPDPATVLAETAGAWATEVDIVKGKSPAGLGTDFAGSVGPPDHSGLIEATVDVIPRATAEAIDEAAIDSGPDDYDTDTEPAFDDEMERDSLFLSPMPPVNVPPRRRSSSTSLAVSTAAAAAPAGRSPTKRPSSRGTQKSSRGGGKQKVLSKALQEAMRAFSPPLSEA